MSITGNFNLFNIPHVKPEAGSSFSSSQGSSQGPLAFALKEVKINTCDSIALAIKILACSDVFLPKLDELQKLHQGKLRDASFAKNSLELKTEVEGIIQKMLNEKTFL